MRILIMLFTFIFFTPFFAMAHPGMTDSAGGHYCWTNCSYWGEVYGQWHYHGLPNTYYNYRPITSAPLSYEAMHELMKNSTGYKKVKNGYWAYDILTCKEGFVEKEDKCEKPKSKKLNASKESKSLSSAAKNERTRLINILNKKRYSALEDLDDKKWKKYADDIIKYAPSSEILKYAPEWFITKNKLK